MLLHGNVCHTGEGGRIGMEEVDIEDSADAEELLGVDGRMVEETLHGAAVDTQLVGQPLVGTALPMQLVADDGANMYLHSGCCLCAWLPIP